jgi:hypothetical protein
LGLVPEIAVGFDVLRLCIAKRPGLAASRGFRRCPYR